MSIDSKNYFWAISSTPPPKPLPHPQGLPAGRSRAPWRLSRATERAPSAGTRSCTSSTAAASAPPAGSADGNPRPPSYRAGASRGVAARGRCVGLPSAAVRRATGEPSRDDGGRMTAAQQRDATEEYDGESDERSRRLTSETEILKVIFADYRFLGKRTKRANVGSVRQRTFIHWRASTRIDAYRRVSTLIDLPSRRHWSDSISREFHQPRFGKAGPPADLKPLTTGQRLTADHRRWSLTTEADHWPQRLIIDQRLTTDQCRITRADHWLPTTDCSEFSRATRGSSADTVRQLVVTCVKECHRERRRHLPRPPA